MPRVTLLLRHLLKKTHSFCVCLCSSPQPSCELPFDAVAAPDLALNLCSVTESLPSLPNNQRYDILRFAPALIFLTGALCSEVIFVLSFTPASRYPCLLHLLHFSVVTHSLTLIIFAAAIAVVNRSLFGSRTPRALAPAAPRAGQHGEACPGLLRPDCLWRPGCLWRRRGSWRRRYGGDRHVKPRAAVATRGGA